MFSSGDVDRDVEVLPGLEAIVVMQYAGCSQMRVHKHRYVVISAHAGMRAGEQYADKLWMAPIL